MTDAYCKKHFIGYCPELSKDCPYCEVERLREQLAGDSLNREIRKLSDRVKALRHIATSANQSATTAERDMAAWREKYNDAVADRVAAEREVERLRLQLAGCGVIALANTRETHGTAMEGILPEYRCASMDDVHLAVLREIEWRERAEAAEHNFTIEHDALQAAERKLAKVVEGLRNLNSFPLDAPAEGRAVRLDDLQAIIKEAEGE